MGGEGDVIVTALTVSRERFDVVNFSPPLGLETYAIFISRSGASEELSWASFLLPFSRTLWLVLAANVLLVVSLVNTFQGMLDKDKGWNINCGKFLSQYWMIFCSYFGRDPKNFPKDRNGSSFFQTIAFIVLLCNNVVFMTYRASLTSELSTRRSKLPFTSLEEFHGTNYQQVDINVLLKCTLT